MKAHLQTYVSRGVDLDGIVASLEAAGVHPSPSEVAVDAPAIVVFDEVTHDLLQCVEHSNDSLQRRVVAISITPSMPSGDAAWRLLAAGASDVVSWDAEHAAAHVAARLQRWASVDALLDSDLVQTQLVGRSPAWRSAMRQVVELASFTDAAVLLTGESGTGKELVARLIHALDRRSDKRDLVTVDCTTIVPSLSGSEFFGHEKGAFTGAISARDGAFAAADGGTLFLDEVGELPLTLQAELLRVVQEGMYKRVGSNTWRRTGFRLICATNRDLVHEQACGSFRRDLYYRIAAARVHLPRLEDRPDDIIPLFRHFLHVLRPDVRAFAIDHAVGHLLVGRSYPGNVRDLRQLAVRVSTRHVGPGPITVGDLAEEDRPAPSEGERWSSMHLDAPIRKALAQGITLKQVREAAADVAVRVASEMADGNLNRAARILGITDRALQLRRAAARQAFEGVTEMRVVRAAAEPRGGE